MTFVKSILAIAFGALLATNLSACSKDAKPGDAAKPAKAAATATAAPAADGAKVGEPGKALEIRAPDKKEESKGADRAGKGEMKEVCHDKMKDGKPVMDKDGKPVQECKMVKVRQKLEAHEIPPAKK